MINSRNSAKAVIIRNNSVLLLKKQYEDGSIKYTLPGGTQEPGEALEMSVIREAYEEVAANITVIKLLNIYEHQRNSKKIAGNVSHKIEFAFLCNVSDDYEPKMGSEQYSHQISVEWINIDSLVKYDLSPPRLAEVIVPYNKTADNIYLGDIS